MSSFKQGVAFGAVLLAGCIPPLGKGGVAGTTTPPERPEVADLGKALFHDKILSGNRNIACNTCHHHEAALGDALPVSLGEGATGIGANRQTGTTGRMIPRNAPALFTTSTSSLYTSGSGGLFWDSRIRVNPTLQTPDFALDSSPDVAYAAIRPQLTTTLAAQALFPVTEPDEMRGQPGTNELADAPDDLHVWQLLMARLVGTQNGAVGGIQAYRDLFHDAYPNVAFDDLNFGHAARAIAAFVRQSFTADGTTYDEFLRGNASAFTPDQQAGYALFTGKANCAQCHVEPLFSDLDHHALAVPQIGPGRLEPHEDRGVALVTGDAADNYKFRTPPLRNVALTGPWMHDGVFTTLDEVVQHHVDPVTSFQSFKATGLRADFAATLDTDPARNAARLAALDPILRGGTPLTSIEVSRIVAFLNALTDPSSVARAQAAHPSSVPSGLPVD